MPYVNTLDLVTAAKEAWDTRSPPSTSSTICR